MNRHCHVTPITKLISLEEQETTTEISLTIVGMGCPNCAMRVHNGLFALKGVIMAQVNHVTASADVVFNPNLLTIFDLVDAVANAGNDGRHHYQVVSSPNVIKA